MRYFQSFSDKYLYAMQDNGTGMFYTKRTVEFARWDIPKILSWWVTTNDGPDYFKEISEEEATVWLLAWEGKDANH